MELLVKHLRSAADAAPELAGIITLVGIACISVFLGPHTRWPHFFVLAWSGVMGFAAFKGWLRFGGCFACGSAEECQTSADPLQSLLSLSVPGQVTPELHLEGLSAVDALVVAGAISEFGGRVGLERLAVVRCPALQVDQLSGFVSTALAGPGLQLHILDLSDNPRLEDAVVEAVCAAMCVSKQSSLKELRLRNGALSAAAVASLASWLADAPSVPPQSSCAPLPTSEESVPPPPPPFSAFPEPVQAPQAAKSAPLRLQPLAETGKDMWSSNGRSQLRLLSLAGNAISGSGRYLYRIAKVSSLRELDLSGCSLDLSDITRLASALPRSALIRLELARNGIESTALLALTTHLAASKIDDLGLADNEIGSGSALTSLAESYAKRRIRFIRLSGNRLSHKELESFLSSLNPSRRSRKGTSFSLGLCLPGCDCDDRGEV